MPMGFSKKNPPRLKNKIQLEQNEIQKREQTCSCHSGSGQKLRHLACAQCFCGAEKLSLVQETAPRRVHLGM